MVIYLLFIKYIVLPLLLLVLAVFVVRFIFKWFKKWFMKRIVMSIIGYHLRQSQKFEEKFADGAVTADAFQRELLSLFLSRWAKTILGVLMMVAIVIPFVSGMIILLVPFGLLAVAGFLLCFLSAKMVKMRLEYLAGLLLRPVLEEVFGDDFTYEEQGHIPEELIVSSGFVGEYTSIEGSDLMRGRYKGVPVMMSDVKVVKVEEFVDEDGDKGTRITKLFEGFWIVADFDRELTPVTLKLVEERNASSIQMESEEFNKKFSVYCQDEHTAYYILTPHFMERLLEVEKCVKGKCQLNFNGNRLQIAFHTNKDQFEVGRFTVPRVEDMKNRFRKELGQMTGVLDEIMRHEKLFGKVDDK